MALTRSDIPELLLPGLRAEFALAYQTSLDRSVGDTIATVVNTTQPIQKYAWMGTVPSMREFVDERTATGLAAYATSIEDKVFESTIAVDRKAIEDDQLDLIRLRIRDMAERVIAHRQQLVVEALVGGFTLTGYDGVSFFHTAHPGQNGSTYGNRTSSGLDSESLSVAINSMMLCPDDQGQPLGIVPDTLLVGPKQQWNALELVESPVVIYKGNASDTVPSTPYKNAFYGRLRVLVSPYLQGASDDHWFLLDTKRPIRGVILQQRSDVPVEFTALEKGSGSESAFLRDRYLYGVRGRYNTGYGLWQTVYGSSS